MKKKMFKNINNFLIFNFYFITLLLLLFISYNDISYSAVGELPARLVAPSRITNLYKDTIYSVNVLSGVAIIRVKNNSELLKNKIIDIVDEFSLKNSINSINIENNDFKIITTLLSPSNAVSNQKDRMNKLTQDQVNKIKDIEKILFRTMIIEFDSLINVLHFCKYIKNKYDYIEVAEPYYIPKLMMYPNDPKINDQEMLSRIDIFNAWDISEGSEDILIGISDCGVNWQHEDLSDGIAINESEIPNDGIDNDNNGYIDDYYGYNFTWAYDASSYDDVSSSGQHGTEVSGIVGARVNNFIGIAGVSNRCKIVPLKTSTKNNYNDVIYGYQSMIYAAIRGCKVLNCSWGIPVFYSIVNQTVVDYATVCDVAIVAAGGNVGSNGAGNYSSFYPAGYFGVLGVGSVDKEDIAGNIVYGVPVRILAPSNGNWTISGSNSYKRVMSGSSFATPVVSGVVGLLKAFKPELNSKEVLEIVRQNADKINDNGKNDYDSAFIPLRVNAHKALLNYETENFSIILVDNFFTDINTGEITNRVDEVDTLELNIILENILNDAFDVQLNFVQIFCMNSNAYTFIEPTLSIGNIKKGERIKYKTKVIVNNPYSDEAIFKVYISGKNKNNLLYEDAFKMRLATNNSVTTFRNDMMVISAGDAGSIGYSTPTSLESFGEGFLNKKLGNFIYEGGVVAVSNLQKAVSVNLDADQKLYDRNSFSISKKLVGDAYNYNINIVRDDKSIKDNKIGIEVTTKYILPDDSSTALKVVIDAKNISGTNLTDFSIGHYYDWDVGKSNARNIVEYCEECIPFDINKDYAAVEIVYDDDSTAYVGSLVYYPIEDIGGMTDYFVLPQAAGIDNATVNIIDKNEQIKALTYGHNLQVGNITDVSYIVGLYFLDKVKPDETRRCIICTAVEDTKEKLMKSLAKCSKKDYGRIIEKEYKGEEDYINLYQKSKHIYFDLKNKSSMNFEIYNNIGIKIFDAKNVLKSGNVNMENFISGLYFFRFYDNKDAFIKTIFYVN